MLNLAVSRGIYISIGVTKKVFKCPDEEIYHNLSVRTGASDSKIFSPMQFKEIITINFKHFSFCLQKFQ